MKPDALNFEPLGPGLHTEGAPRLRLCHFLAFAAKALRPTPQPGPFKSEPHSISSMRTRAPGVTGLDLCIRRPRVVTCSTDRRGAPWVEPHLHRLAPHPVPPHFLRYSCPSDSTKHHTSCRHVRLWNYLEGSCELDRAFPEEALSVAVHPTGTMLLVGGPPHGRTADAHAPCRNLGTPRVLRFGYLLQSPLPHATRKQCHTSSSHAAGRL